MKRSANVFEHDKNELAASSLGSKKLRTQYDDAGMFSSLKQPLTNEHPLADHEAVGKQNLSTVPPKQQEKAQLDHEQFRRKFEDFPPLIQPLPTRISLTALAREFPNHLQLSHVLRRFVEAG